MLINCDVKALEVCCAAFLSTDKVLTEELLSGVDIHEVNQKAFNLSNRLIAKKFIFRILYGGTAFSFVKDPEFFEVSQKLPFWANVIDNFYSKYKGLYAWHTKLVQDVVLSGKYTSPTGREYLFKPYLNKRGEHQWPRTNILNYPVQGLGSDMVAIFRISLWNRIKCGNLTAKPIATVHDSVLLDVPLYEVNHVVSTIKSVAKDIPLNFYKLFNVKYTLPFVVEIEIGDDYLNMEKVTP